MAAALTLIEPEHLLEPREKNTCRCRPYRWIERDIKFDHSHAHNEKVSDEHATCFPPEGFAPQAIDRAYRSRAVDDL